MTAINVAGHRMAKRPAATQAGTLRLRTVGGQYLHADIAEPALVASSMWAWQGTLPQLNRVLKLLPAELRDQLIPCGLNGLPVRFRRVRA